VRRALPGVNAELAAAVRRVNATYSQIPESCRPDIAGERWANLERELDRACGAHDHDAAGLAIETWEAETLAVLTRCLANAPLEIGSSS